MKKITLIGGGTGTFVVLSALKNYPLDLGVIVSMMDSGGSTGRLRDQLGVLPPGDLRQCLVALSEAPLLWRKLFLYRFENGDLAGHNFGNLFLSALEKVSKNYDEVIEMASFVLKTKGHVIPVTYDKTHLVVKYANGKRLKGEGNIDKNTAEKSRIVESYLEPAAKPNLRATNRLLESNFIIVGPGDMYASTLTPLLVEGLKKAAATSKAKMIYIMNLMTKSGQTTNYKASDHVEDVAKYFGRLPDIVVINNGTIPTNVIKWYQAYQEHPVEDDLVSSGYKGKIVKSDLIDRTVYPKAKNDKFVSPQVRSILRHDQKKLGLLLEKLIL